MYIPLRPNYHTVRALVDNYLGSRTTPLHVKHIKTTVNGVTHYPDGWYSAAQRSPAPTSENGGIIGCQFLPTNKYTYVKEGTFEGVRVTNSSADFVIGAEL